MFGIRTGFYTLPSSSERDRTSRPEIAFISILPRKYFDARVRMFSRLVLRIYPKLEKTAL